ncbi:zinc finger protein PLAGL2 [Chlorocebus sabaeus]|nr:zinc finger protein PLAGL2 isoform X2 [Papio anubis]XP_005568718.1 zinc finger protein PLAGL2 [Macaca fascicularis]XP_008018624.1 zinc finger protein PLAGL2 [Chlorocebus sabaeus]XP_009214621.1 zinc finger protein PLAGL2 isoform X2 [Papio anubis]XP_010351074.1 zinc finger protein PLAGL2 [Rhinopithecus roxellana]XP_011907879.1 PREDICTED: zinc finger protein PLAGL2 isoform X1 [Cercocebus atys]XP_015004752.1 zinc finger protein PLAGL2 [Macaca mulatta]XP_017720555.1 PREDICTED: zinc finger prot
MTTFFTSVPPWIQDAKQEEEVGWKLVPRPRGREAESQVKCQCEISGTPFSNGEKLRPHTLPQPEQRPYSCPQLHCGKAFASKYKLYRHMATHSAQKPHQCMYCDKMFHRKDHLRNHLQTHDPNKEALHCSECGKNYNTKLGYRRHLAMHAASSGDLSCKVCLQTFESTQALLEHLKAHSRRVAGGAKEKKHPCDHCDRRFYTRKDVRRHLVVHTGRKDFLCQYCAQRFGRKDHLTRHVKKSHSQELLKIKTEPVDMLGLLSCSSTVSVKEELSPVLCMASRDVMGTKAFPGMLPMGMYGAHIPTMPSTGMPHSLVHNTLPMGMSYPLESSPISSPAQLPPKYQLGSTSYLPDKLPKVEVDSFLAELPGSLSLSSAEPQPASPQPAAAAALLDEALLAKSPANLSEALCAANVDFSHLLGFLPLNLPPCNPPGATGGLVMGYSQAEAQPLLTTLQAQPQDSPGAGGPLNFGPLHSLPPVFTSGLSSTTLPRFHQAFQ